MRRRIKIGIWLLIFALTAGGCQTGAPVSETEETIVDSRESSEEPSVEETKEEVTTEAETTAAETTEAEEETTAKAQEEEVLKTIGVEGSGDDWYCVRLKNSTGKDITGVSVRSTGEEEFPENMLTEDEVFAVREERLLYYDASKAASEVTEDDKLLTPGYDIRLTFSDETEVVLHAFPFGDLEEGSICCITKEWIGFVRYFSLSSGEKVTTKDAEVFIRQSEEAAREEERLAQEEESRAAEEAAAESRAAEAEAQRRAEAQRKAEEESRAAASQPTAAQPTAPPPTAAQPTAPAAPPAAPTQAAEGCLDDPLFN